jgi:hypothetical protein
MNKRHLTSKEKVLIGVTAFAVFLIPASAYRNATPVVSVPTPVMPSPNAHDYYAKAVQLHTTLVRTTLNANSVDPITDGRNVQGLTAQQLKQRYPTAAKEAWLRKNAVVLQTLRRGFKYSHLSPPVRSYSTPLPYIATYRSLGRLLRIESHAKAERGDWIGASQSAIDVLRLGHTVPRGAPHIGAFVGYALNTMGVREFDLIIPHLDAKTARSTASEIEGLYARRVTLAQTLQEDKKTNQAALLEMFKMSHWRYGYSEMTGEKEGFCGMATADLTLRIRLEFTRKQAIMDEYTRFMDFQIAEASHPYSSRHLQNPAVGRLYVERLAAKNEMGWATTCSETSVLLLMTALALRAFQAEHGQFPATLSQLSPAYLKQIPTDPFGSGEPLHYRKSRNSYVLYSVGPDGKDDSGRHIDNAKDARYRVQFESKGDMVAGINY